MSSFFNSRGFDDRVGAYINAAFARAPPKRQSLNTTNALASCSATDLFHITGPYNQTLNPQCFISVTIPHTC